MTHCTALDVDITRLRAGEQKNVYAIITALCRKANESRHRQQESNPAKQSEPDAVIRQRRRPVFASSGEVLWGFRQQARGVEAGGRTTAHRY